MIVDRVARKHADYSVDFSPCVLRYYSDGSDRTVTLHSLGEIFDSFASEIVEQRDDEYVEEYTQDDLYDELPPQLRGIYDFLSRNDTNDWKMEIQERKSRKRNATQNARMKKGGSSSNSGRWKFDPMKSFKKRPRF